MNREIRIEIDFKQLLEDISYTNKISKKYNVSNIISRNQYYELKDALVLWLAKSDIVSTNIDGMEYTVGKNGDIIPLLKLTITYKDIRCPIHQNFRKRLKKLFNIKFNEDSSERYVYHGSEVEYNEEEFVSAINRMYAVRIKFLRATLGSDAFWATYNDNKIRQGDMSWMVRYIDYLPNNEEGWFKIVEKQ